MSGCCGQGPVIVAGTPTPRVDVETVLLCDVQVDGTVAATVLVEPVYDTNSGARVGTRIVDPVTGADYTPTGTLGPCQPEGCARQVLRTLRCDDADGDGSGEISYVELWAVDPCTGEAPELIGTYQDGDLGSPYTPVAPVDCPPPAECPTCTEQVLCDTGPVTSPIGPMPPNPAGGYTLANGVTWSRTAADVLLFGNDRWRADADPATFSFSEPVTLEWAVAFSGAGTTTVVIPQGSDLVSLSPGHAWDATTRRLSATANTVDANQTTTFRARDVSTWTAPALDGAVGGAFAYYGDMLVTVDVAHPFLRTTCRDCSGAVVSQTDTELDGTTAYAPTGTVGVCGPVEGDRQRYDAEVIDLCDTATDGTSTPFLRHLLYGTLDGIVYSSRDTTLDGTSTYTPAGTVGRCPATTDCASPTTPVATVGLCLADGTPIAVTVQRDCDGVVASEGWINLVTGTYSAGAPPAGTGACGDSQSVQVSGTFCDIDAAGDVVGLVLVEYSYAADGTIDSVRLVDAVTGTTYVPQGEITVCPAGVEQPEQDVVQLCDVAADGTSTPFVRDYRRDETGAIVGHSDYGLDGSAYTPTGTVGLCSTPQPERDLTVLCDTLPTGEVTEFVRDYERDDAGTVVGHSDYSLDGAPYTVTGTVGTCAPPCLDCETVTLCDSTPQPVGLTVTAAEWACRYMTAPDLPTCLNTECRINNPDEGQGFFDGGTVIFPNRAEDPDCGNTGTHLGIAGVIRAPASAACPECYSADDEFTLTISGQSTNDGPGSGVITDGRVNLFRDQGEPDGTLPQVVPQLTDANRAPGTTWDWSVTATVTWQDLQTGRLVFTLDHETKANGQLKQWTAQGFTITAEPVAPKAGCGNTFRRTLCRDCTGAIVSTTDYEPDGITPYTPVGDVSACTTCTPAAEECPTVAVQTLRLCDLDPDVTPDAEGRRCAVPFLRHLTYDCSGALLSSTDTAMDGTTPYTPVAVVDCGASGVPAQVELVWPQTGIAEDPDGLPAQDFIYTVTNPDTGDTAEVHLHASRQAGGNCGPYDPTNPGFNNPTVYTLTLDAVAQEMTVFRLDLVDFDTFEGVTQLNPPPDRVEGDVTWNGGSTVIANQSNITAYLYWDNPPEQISYRYGNTGGGTACSAVAFQGVTLKPEGCCGCSSDSESCAKQIVERCGCDDADGDGIGEVTYTELWAVDPCGGEPPELLGAFLDGDLTQPYTPVAPVECTAGMDETAAVHTGARRMSGDEMLLLSALHPGLQSVTLTVLAGEGTATTDDGIVTIPAGTTLTWSVTKDSDQALATWSGGTQGTGSDALLTFTYRS